MPLKAYVEGARACHRGGHWPLHLHSTHQGDNGWHILRKEEAGIHIRNSSHTKNIKPTQAIIGCSHIKQTFKTMVGDFTPKLAE